MEIASASSPLIEARGIVKRFGGFEANRGISLAIHAGERHALLGQNGAGKSTLVKILYGVLQPTAGDLLWNGAPVRLRNPADARSLGIGMVFQEFTLFEELTVAENLALGLPEESMRDLRARISDVSSSYGLAIEPEAPVYHLSVGERQRVGVLRCLLQNPKLLILDEPTSVLTPQEAERLFAILRRLSDEGRAILYISHRLEEVRALCDRATILRDGEVVSECDPARESVGSLAERMIGETAAGVERAGGQGGETRLKIEDLSIKSPALHGMDIADVSLEVRSGEIVGVAGVAGEGQAELMSALTGEITVKRADCVQVDGRPLGRAGPAGRRMRGMAFVPEQRLGHASVRDMSLEENVLLTHHQVARLAPWGWIRPSRVRDWTRRIRESFSVRAGSDRPTAGSLSGGNLQKFVVGREILREPGVLVACQPTWGVDAGAAAEIRRALVGLARRGCAVLVISQDLDEVFEISDRIAVLRRGRLSPPEPAEAMSAERAGLLMGGAA